MVRLSPSAVLKLAFALCIVVVQSVAAAPFTFSGELSPNDSFFNRPRSMTGISRPDAHYAYDVIGFRVSEAGTYAIEATAFDAHDHDTYLALYQGSFRAAEPLSNLLQVNDDGGFGFLSLISWALQTDTDYLLVFTSYSQLAFGAYAGSIDAVGGSGQVSIPDAAEVQEPGDAGPAAAGRTGPGAGAPLAPQRRSALLRVKIAPPQEGDGV
jgi:hypothetical protein